MGAWRLVCHHGFIGLLGLWLLLIALPLWADAPAEPPATGAAPESPLELERRAEGLFLSVRQSLELSPAVEDTLYRAVPLYFVYQAEVLRNRWYWTDKRVAGATRTLRLAYQPLTRRWRLSIASGAGGPPGPGLQYALHLNYDTLSEAVAAVGRVARWKIADGEALSDNDRYRVEYRFRLDLSLLPRPLQIGMANQPDWVVERQQRMDVPPLSSTP